MPAATRRATRATTTTAAAAAAAAPSDSQPSQVKSTSKSHEAVETQKKAQNARGGKKRRASSSAGADDGATSRVKKVTKKSHTDATTTTTTTTTGATAKAEQQQQQKKKSGGSSSSLSKTPTGDGTSASANSTVFPVSTVEFHPFNIAASTTTKSTVASSPLKCQRSHHQPSPSPPSLIFTHGAGGDLSAPAIVHFSQGFTSMGSGMVMFEGNSNMKSRAAGFGRMLEHGEKEKWWWVLRGENDDDEQTGRGGRTPALGGRSLGARAAVAAALDFDPPSHNTGRSGLSLVLSSYPLVSPAGDVRDQILLALPHNVDVLFISGDNDSMCPLDRLQAVRDKMKAPSWLVVVKGADHGMKVKGGKDLKTGCERVGLVCGWLAWRWCTHRDGDRDGDRATSEQGKKGQGRQMTVKWDGDMRRVVLDGWDGTEEEVVWGN